MPPDTWTGCEYPDPIVILPIEDAVGELSDYDRDQQEYTRAFGGFRFPIAPDAFHKADVSGGMWYKIPFFPQPLPPDPIVSDIPYAVKTLSEYLTFALNWGGFPGLSKVDAHNWPLIDLTKGG